MLFLKKNSFAFATISFEMGRVRKADWAQKKKLKVRRRIKEPFEKDKILNLAISDKGSWFDQENLYIEGSESESDGSDEEEIKHNTEKDE